MPAEVFKLVIDNSNFATGLKESEAQAAASTSAITASLQKIEGGGANGAKGIHLVTDSLKMTRAEIRESNGSIAMLGEMLGVHIPRHARSMLASLEVIGPAMNAAFNTVAIIAVGMAIFEAGKRAYEFFQKADEAAEKARTANDELAGSLNKSNLEEQSAIDKVEKHIAVLEKKPYNALKAALDEAALSSVNLAQKLDAAIQKERALLQSQDAGFMAQHFEGKAGTGSAQNTLNTYNTGQNNIDVDFQNQLDQAQRLGKSKADVDALELAHLQAKAKYTVDTYNTVAAEIKLREEYDKLTSEHAGFNGQGHNATDRARWNQLNTMFSGQADQSTILPALRNMLGNIGMLGHGQQLDATMQEDKTTEANDEEKNRLAEVGKQASSTGDKKQMEGFEASLTALKLTHKLTIAEEMAFWQEMQAKTREGSANWNAINKTLGNETQQNLAEIHAGFNKVRKNTQGTAPAENPAQQMQADQMNNLMRTGDKWRAFDDEVSKGALIQGDVDRELKLTNIQIELSRGLITRHAAALQEGTIHAAIYAAKIAELRAELKAITDVDPFLLDPKNAAAAQKLKNQITTTQGQAQVTAAKDKDASGSPPLGSSINGNLKDMAEQFTDKNEQAKQLQDQFFSGLNQNFTAFLTGQKTNWTSFLRSLASSLMGDALKNLEGGLISHMPHFADGGYTGSDPVVVGERGIEIFNPGNGGMITPNHKLTGSSSGPSIGYVDARGTDPVQTHIAIIRAMQATHTQAVRDAGAAMQERSRRTAH